MLDIVITACLIAAPNECVIKRFKTDLADYQYVQCIMTSPSMIARFVSDNPSQHVKEWECRKHDDQDS
jgi:hypothetical protein